MSSYIIQATTPHHPDDRLPALRYWNATTLRWTDYQHATVYDTNDLTCPQGPRATSTTRVIAPYPVDADGFPYRIDDVLGPVRMTHCCGAATSCDDTSFYCKSCYGPTPADYEVPARPTTQEHRTANDHTRDGSAPAKPDQAPTDMTEVFAALAQRIVDGHADGTATAGPITITLHVGPDHDRDPVADNPAAYTFSHPYTNDAVAAFRRGEWSFTTITLQIDTCRVHTQARERGIEHGLTSSDVEREYLAESLLPVLFSEAASNLRAAVAAVERPHRAGSVPLAIPATLPAARTDEHWPVIAWLPTFTGDDGFGAVAVCFRDQPEYGHRPYTVGTVKPDPDNPDRYAYTDGPHEAEDLGEAMIEATLAADDSGERDGADT